MVLIKRLIKLKPEKINKKRWCVIVVNVTYRIILRLFTLLKSKSFKFVPRDLIKVRYFGLKYPNNKLLKAWIGPIEANVPDPTSTNSPIKKEEIITNKCFVLGGKNNIKMI